MTTPTPMNCSDVSAALADYLDDDAPESMRSNVESHVSWCAECNALLSDIVAIRSEAAELPPLTPSRDLWAGIAERLETPVIALGTTPVASRRQRWLVPALAAAALVVVTAGITHVLTRASLTGVSGSQSIASVVAPVVVPETTPAPSMHAVIPEIPVAAPNTAATPRAAVTRFVSAEPVVSAEAPMFRREIGKLRRIVNERRAQLDPATVAVLERSIVVIDSAIAQSRAALLKDPASGFLASQLTHSLEKKVELLRTAASLPARS